MALVQQIIAVSYNAVLANERGAHNQWGDSSLLQEMERKGGVVRKSLGPQIEAPLDYRRNPGAVVLTSDFQQVNMTKTEVITSALFDVAEVSVPVKWSKKDEAQNPSENQKIALATVLMKNGIQSHDDVVEQALAATSTNGLLGFLTHLPTSGQGTDGTIDSAAETWWRNVQGTYIDDTDVEAALTSAWNRACKGSSSVIKPNIIVSDGATNALFEGTQTPNQRWNDSQSFKAGATSLMFKTANTVFSQYFSTSFFGFNTKTIQLVVSKEYFREKGEVQEIDDINGFIFKIYSALQLTINNRSRAFVVHL